MKFEVTMKTGERSLTEKIYFWFGALLGTFAILAALELNIEVPYSNHLWYLFFTRECIIIVSVIAMPFLLQFFMNFDWKSK